MANIHETKNNGHRTLTKADIVAKIHEKVGYPKKESAQIVELLLEIVKETLTSGEKIKISGFGNFVIRDKKPRRGRNPQTGEAIQITPRKVLTFRSSSILRKGINAHSQFDSKPFVG